MLSLALWVTDWLPTIVLANLAMLIAVMRSFKQNNGKISKFVQDTGWRRRTPVSE